MKIKLLSIIAFSVCALAFTSQAQSYAAQAITIPTVAAGATSNSIGAVIDCRKQRNVAIQWVINGGTPFLAGTNATANISTSVDGLSFQTNRFTLRQDLTATPNNVLATNLSVDGIGYLRVDSVTATGIICTNVMKYGIKLNSP